MSHTTINAENYFTRPMSHDVNLDDVPAKHKKEVAKRISQLRGIWNRLQDGGDFGTACLRVGVPVMRAKALRSMWNRGGVKALIPLE